MAISKIQEGQTGAEVASLIYSNDVLGRSPYLLPSSKVERFPVDAVLNFKMFLREDEEGEKYYISYFFNTASTFLLQIVDSAGGVVAQKYEPSTRLTGVNKIELRRISDSKIFAEATIDADKISPDETGFGLDLELNTHLMEEEEPPIYGEDFDAPSSQKMAAILSREFLGRSLDYNSAFPFWGILDVEVVKGDPSLFDVDRPLYLTFIRGKSATNTSTIIQISQKNGADLDLFANANTDAYPAEGVQSFTLIGAKGLRIMVTVDWSITTTDTYVLDTSVPLNTEYLKGQARANHEATLSPFFDKHTLNYSGSFPYWGILDVEVLSGPVAAFYEGYEKSLFLTFIRGKDATQSSTIIQISRIDGGQTSLFAAVNTDEIDAFNIQSFILSGEDNLKIRLTLDWSVVGTATWVMTTEVMFRTSYLATKARSGAGSTAFKPLAGRTVVHFGDSVVEFGDIPYQIARMTGATVYKVGFGGCRMAKHEHPDYDKLSMYFVAQSVASGDFSAMQTAVDNLILIGDDNSEALNTLKSIDFNSVDIVLISYGTNDFTAGSISIGEPYGADFNLNTIKGATASVIRDILSAYPHLRLVFSTPTHRFFGDPVEDSDTAPNSAGVFLREFVDGIIEVSQYQHTPVYDAYRRSGLNKYNHSEWFDDGVHPNAKGNAFLAGKLSSFLESEFNF